MGPILLRVMRPGVHAAMTEVLLVVFTARRTDRNPSREIGDRKVYTTDWASALTKKLEDEADMAWYDDARVQIKPSESFSARWSLLLLSLLYQRCLLLAR